MGILDRFRGQKSVLPDEVKQYYQSSQGGQRRGVALVLGLVALIITIAFASALFFGGRFVYRQIGNDNKTATEQQKEPAGSSGVTGPGNNNQTQRNPAQPTPQPPAPAPRPTPNPPTRTPSTSPALGDEPAPSAPIPNTGPGEIAALAFGSTFIGALAVVYWRRFEGMVASMVSRL